MFTDLGTVGRINWGGEKAYGLNPKLEIRNPKDTQSPKWHTSNA
jgi:hypothetical protein